MNPLIKLPLAIFAFVVLWNIIWGPTPKGTPWSVFMPRVFWVALFFGVAFFGMLVWAKHSLGA